MTAVRLGKLVLLATLLLVAGTAFGIYHTNQVDAHRGQEVANCVVALHETWAYCSKLYP